MTFTEIFFSWLLWCVLGIANDSFRSFISTSTFLHFAQWVRSNVEIGNVSFEPTCKNFINGSFEDRSSFLIYCFLQKCMKHYVETIYLGGMKLNFNWFQIIIDFLFPASSFCFLYARFISFYTNTKKILIKGLILWEDHFWHYLITSKQLEKNEKINWKIILNILYTQYIWKNYKSDRGAKFSKISWVMECI